MAATLAAGLLLLTACGLDYIPYLEPPIGGGFSGSAFTFYCTTANSEAEFEGFELYYKFYAERSDAQEALTSRSALVAAGFQRICGAPPEEYHNDIDKPLIEVAGPADITFVLDFSVTPEPKVYRGAVGDVVMRRSAHYSSSSAGNTDQFKSFRYAYDLTEQYMETEDPDYGSEVRTAIDEGRDLYLTLYVLSYGRQDVFNDLYSDAIPLSTIGPINFGW